MIRLSTKLMERFRTIARLSLAAILLLAAGFKAHQLLTDRIISTGWLNARPAQAGVVVMETLLALWLVCGWYPALAGRVTVACFAIFAGVALWKLAGGEPSCGCFGKVPVRPWQVLVFDLLALPVGFAIGKDCRRPQPGPGWGVLGGCVAILMVVGTGGFVKMAFFGPRGRPDVEAVVIDSAKWVGGPWLIGEYIDVWPELSHGKWAVLFYSPDCSDCLSTLRAYAELANQWSARGEPARIALIATTDGPPGDDFPDLNKSTALKGNLEVPAGKHWFIPPPTLAVLLDGKVLVVADGEGYCDWEDGKFRKW